MVIGLALSCLLVSQAAAAPKPASPTHEALALLDGDAGLVIAIRISQFQRLHELVVESFPKDRGSVNLAALAATALIGFHPFRTDAWIDRGFDPQSKILVQVGAIDRAQAKEVDRGKGEALWRTRIVLRASDAGKVKASLSQIRFRQRARLEVPGDSGLETLLKVDDQVAAKLRTKLQGAGVFLVAEPAPLPGLLLISQRRNLFIIDVLAPYGPSDAPWRWTDHQALLLQMVGRRPQSLRATMPGAGALIEGSVAVWMRTALIGEALAANELDGEGPRDTVRRQPQCEAFANLARQSEFPSLSLQAEMQARQVDLEVQWHLRATSQLSALLTTESAPLLSAGDQALHATLRLARPGSFRGRKRPAVAAAWDSLWKSAKLCGPGSKAFALAIAWPEIVGLFLDELSALHPQARALIDSLGALAITAPGTAKKQGLVAEAWVRKPGDQLARQWLDSLFGHQRSEGETRGVETNQWGVGRMRPYAMGRDGGSVIGALLGPARVSFGETRAARGSPGRAIFELRARPSALAPELVEHPLTKVFTPWRHLSADLLLVDDTLRFTIAVKKD